MYIIMKNILSKINLKLIFNWLVGFFAYLLMTIFYQKFSGQEPFNNGFIIGLPKFYHEFYVGNCLKLHGGNGQCFIINVIIYTFLFFCYVRLINKKNF